MKEMIALEDLLERKEEEEAQEAQEEDLEEAPGVVIHQELEEQTEVVFSTRETSLLSERRSFGRRWVKKIKDRAARIKTLFEMIASLALTL